MFLTQNPWLHTDFILGNWLFGSVKLTNNVDLDKYVYTGYGIGFNSRSKFLLPDGSMGENVIYFGADMSSSVHIHIKGKDILVLREGQIQGLDNTTLTAKAKYPISFTQPRKRFVLCLHYNGNNSFLFVNATKIYQFKVKELEKKNYAMCFVSIYKILQLITWKVRIKRNCKFFFCWF